MLLLLCSSSLFLRLRSADTNVPPRLVLKGAGNGQLEQPGGVAVNEVTGMVYVADSVNNRVEFFSAGGTYEGQFNGSGTLA